MVGHSVSLRDFGLLLAFIEAGVEGKGGFKATERSRPENLSRSLAATIARPYRLEEPRLADDDRHVTVQAARP